jgi:hydroxymethylbilane synthase
MSSNNTVETGAAPAPASPTDIVIATRQSPLALWQAEHVRARLRALAPGASVELLGMTTEGDRRLGVKLAAIGGKGLFVKELEQAMLEGRAHLAVHSMKDVPAELPDGFVLAAIMARADVRDALVSREGYTLDSLPRGARVGTSSLRRRAQLLLRRPDLVIVDVRGNVGTRMGRIDSGDVDAVVLAHAGLERLGMTSHVMVSLPVDASLPAGGQGALGIETRSDAKEIRDLVARLADAGTTRCVNAEREVGRILGGGCTMPLGAYAEEAADGTLHLRALLAEPDGGKVLRAEARGADALALGGEVAAALRAQGADAILAALAAGS